MIVKTCLLVFFLVFFPVFSPFFSQKFYLIFSRFVIHFSLFGLCAVDNWWHGTFACWRSCWSRGWWLAAMPTTCGGFRGLSWGHFVGDRFAKFWMVVVLVSDNFSGICMPLTCLVTLLKFHQFPGWVVCGVTVRPHNCEYNGTLLRGGRPSLSIDMHGFLPLQMLWWW